MYAEHRSLGKERETVLKGVSHRGNIFHADKITTAFTDERANERTNEWGEKVTGEDTFLFAPLPCETLKREREREREREKGNLLVRI